MAELSMAGAGEQSVWRYTSSIGPKQAMVSLHAAMCRRTLQAGACTHSHGPVPALECVFARSHAPARSAGTRVRALSVTKSSEPTDHC